MRKSTVWSSVSAIGGILGLLLFSQAPVFPSGDDVKIQGEIVGLACLLSHGDMAKGEDHKKCAIHCVEKGQPIGLLTDDGTVYILYAGMVDFQPFETAKSRVGHRVEVTGTIGKKANLMGLTVNEVRPL